jgi:hypothetical protein
MICEQKKALVNELYMKLLEGQRDATYIVDKPEILFDGNYIDGIRDFKRQLFYSQFSKEIVFAEVERFDFERQLYVVLFKIMARQLELYAPNSAEYQEVLDVLETHPAFE